MRILVVNQHYWPEIAATAQLLSDLCEDIAAAGHDVTVICGQPSYRVTDPGQRKLPAEEVHRGVRIVRVPNYAPTRRDIPRRLAHYGSFFASAQLASLTQPRFDVALVLSTPPLLLGVQGTLLRLLRGIPFVQSVQDLYPDIALNLGVLKPGLLASGLEAVAGVLYRQAAAIVTLSDAMASALERKGVYRGRITVIPNWMDTDAVHPSPRDNALARELGLTGRFVVLYSGNVGLSQGLEHLPDVAEGISDLPVDLVVAGDGNARPGLERAIRERGLANLRLQPPQPRERLNELLASCEVGLVTMRRGIASDLVPSKLYGIMAAGRPVLASVEAGSEVAKVLGETGAGVTVAPEDPSALADAIRALASSPERLPAMGDAGRAAAVARYSRKAATASYLDVLQRVADG